jgi:hypothetical protein
LTDDTATKNRPFSRKTFSSGQISVNQLLSKTLEKFNSKEKNEKYNKNKKAELKISKIERKK